MRQVDPEVKVRARGGTSVARAIRATAQEPRIEFLTSLRGPGSVGLAAMSSSWKSCMVPERLEERPSGRY
jgi:hypothetical protein